MAINVKGYRLLIKPDMVDLKTPAGLVIAADRKLEQAAQVRGYVHSVGERCWEGHEPYAAVGDYVMYSKYAGKVVEDPETNDQFVIINDEDILAVITNAPAENESLDSVVKALDGRRESVG